MFVRVEPIDWSMYSVSLFFSDKNPNPEDETVRQYLIENGLEPKREFDTNLEGEDFNVMYFGGCYLGQHMSAISKIQQDFVERELLATEIPELLRIGPDVSVAQLVASMDEGKRQQILDSLVKEFHHETSFETDPENQIQVMLDPSEVQQAFLKLMASEAI